MQSGLLFINKERGLTSFDCVNHVKKVLKTKKVGHTGTLDPLACGLLVICIDDATKLVPYFENHNKVYQGEMILGYGTDTFDTTGKTVKTSDKRVTDEEIRSVFRSFIGPYDQMVPIYSAVKVDGKALYQYARKQVDVDLPVKQVRIYDLIVEKIERSEVTKVTFKAKVSKGTYIRRLIDDIGNTLGCYAVMSYLNRLKVGDISLEQAISLKDLEEGKYEIHPMEAYLPLPKYEISNLFMLKLIKNGVKLTLEEVFTLTRNNEDQVAFLYEGKLVAIYQKHNNSYQAVRVWN